MIETDCCVRDKGAKNAIQWLIVSGRLRLSTKNAYIKLVQLLMVTLNHSVEQAVQYAALLYQPFGKISRLPSFVSRLLVTTWSKTSLASKNIPKTPTDRLSFLCSFFSGMKK